MALITSETYILEADIAGKVDESCVIIYQKLGKDLIPVNTLYGEEAEKLYFGTLWKDRKTFFDGGKKDDG